MYLLLLNDFLFGLEWILFVKQLSNKTIIKN